ncbi:hypothetical protein ACFLSI_00775 [Bacteroidota bacterium]
MSINQIFSIITIILSIILLVYLFIEKKQNTSAKIIIILFLTSIIIHTLFNSQIFQFSDFSEVLIGFFVNPLILVFAPLLYLYFRWIIFPEHYFGTKDLKLLTPFFLVLLVNVLFFTYFAVDNVNVFTEKQGIGTVSNYEFFSSKIISFATILFLFQFLLYSIIMIFLLILKGKKRQFVTQKTKKRFISLAWLFISFFVLFSTYSFLSFIKVDNESISISGLFINFITIVFIGIVVLQFRSINESNNN